MQSRLQSRATRQPAFHLLQRNAPNVSHMLRFFLTPEISMQIQTTQNDGIVMLFDECTPYISVEPKTTSTASIMQVGLVGHTPA